jgi:hypothetical protein
MRFKELTSEKIEQARKIYLDKSLSWDTRMKQLMDLFGRSERTVRKWCSERLKFKEITVLFSRGSSGNPRNYLVNKEDSVY